MLDREEAELLLQAWGWWASTDLPGPHGWNHRCGSAEGRYLSAANDDDRRPARRVTISDEQALVIDRVVGGCGRYTDTLIAVHVDQRPPATMPGGELLVGRAVRAFSDAYANHREPVPAMASVVAMLRAA
jgi:hypothetical protein